MNTFCLDLFEVATILLEVDPEPANAPGYKGQTPLTMALIKRNLKMIKLLLSVGADPRIPANVDKTSR